MYHIRQEIRESIKRSLYKTLSWRIFAIIGTTVIVFIFTKKITISVGVGISDGILKTLMYFAHERLWARIHPQSDNESRSGQ